MEPSSVSVHFDVIPVGRPTASVTHRCNVINLFNAGRARQLEVILMVFAGENGWVGFAPT